MCRSIVLTIGMCIALSAAAIVPPRDPSKWDAWQAQHAAELNRQQMPAVTKVGSQRTIIPRILVIAANFSDVALISTIADIDSMFNGQNWTKDGATGSIRQYFYDQSMGQYNPQFDVVGPITLSNSYAYYGANVGNNTSSKAGYMVTEACTLVNDQVDFTQYDSDNDGCIDLVFVFYAGYGENDYPDWMTQTQIDNLLWPQYWDAESAGYGSNQHIFDGKRVKAMEYSNELDGRSSTETNPKTAGIGVACHEFCHALGLPDLYTTNGATHKTLSSWDIMCLGLYNNNIHTPAGLSAYERFFLGWLTPTLIVDSANLTLGNLATTNTAYLISETDEHNMNGLSPDPASFYLLENRQKNGWDSYLPASGMLLTHINYSASKWTSNTVNNTENAQGVDLIEADGETPKSNTYYGYYGKAGDAFPHGATSYSGITDHELTDIAMADGIISFAYRGGIVDTIPQDTIPVDTVPQDTDSITTSLPIESIQMHTYRTIRDGQMLIHTPNGTYNLYGIKQDD